MSFVAFGGFSIQNVARVMGLLFGSAGAHTYLPKIWVSRPSSTQSQTVTDLSQLTQVQEQLNLCQN